MMSLLETILREGWISAYLMTMAMWTFQSQFHSLETQETGNAGTYIEKTAEGTH